jgi:intracellular sulfur oxidation DsrE/DsrF family protein
MAVSTVTLRNIGEAIHKFVGEHKRKPRQITLNYLTAINLEVTVGEVSIQRVKYKGDKLYLYNIPVETPKGFRRNGLKLA